MQACRIALERVPHRAIAMRVAACSVTLVIACVSCCGGRDRAEQPESDVADVNALHGDFIAALKRRLWSGTGGFQMCVLEPETVTYRDDREEKDADRWEEFQRRLSSLRRDTYDNFWSENGHRHPIAPTGDVQMKLHVLTKAEDAELAEIAKGARLKEYWEAFHTKYGNAVRVGLSAPGFSGDRGQAMIYYTASFDWLAAWGTYCLLKRESDGWVITEEYCVWQS